MRTSAFFVWVLAGLFLSACGGDPASEAPLRLPEKEKTWVKTEKVDKTTEEVLGNRKKTALQVAVNSEQREALLQIPTALGAVGDKAICLEQLNALDQKRTAVQREGGLWHAFERVASIRPFSNNGVQLDSNMNKLIFSLRHLCETQRGVPMDALASQIYQSIQDKGRDATKEELISWGEAPKTADQWMAYSEQAKKNSMREVDFGTIEGLLMRAKKMVLLYEDLLHRNVDESNEQAFLTDAVTLLDALNTSLNEDKHLMMALKEDLAVPHRKFRGEM